MTNGSVRGNQPDRPAPETREEFEAVVRNLLIDAHSRGVPIGGGIDVECDDDESAWTVEVTELVVDPDGTA